MRMIILKNLRQTAWEIIETFNVDHTAVIDYLHKLCMVYSMSH